MPPTNPDFSDDSNPPIRVEHDCDGDTRPSIAIVRAIAVIEDVDPMASATELGVTLYDHVDPSALDRILSGTDADGTVTVDFTIRNDHHYSVRMHDTGHLIVEKAV